MSSKQLTHFTGYEMMSTMPILKTQMPIYQSKVSLYAKMFFVKSTLHLDSQIMVRSLYGNETSTFDFGP